ncbi:MAG TPA: hypothetical protein VI612_05080 [Candidatus Nanoarchaeia archaeon]|nr:hypothetical protein [Candidatus Nanoarchaeia archaeon]
MKTKIILAIVLLILLVSCGQPAQMEEAPKAEPTASIMPPLPEVEPPASSPYEHENTTA